jgi:diguanylate cyclase (GGDEF)-like protein
LNYQISSKNRYQYMLQGFDKDWSPPRANREAAYTNLPPGKYTLLVRCTNNDGVWGEITQLPIEIIPPWWQTLPFQIGMALLIVGIVAGGVHLRLSQVRAANRKLEQRVAERTGELETEIFLRKQIEKRLQEQLNQISVLQNELRHQAMHDALTGLLNRHQMDSILTAELSRAKRVGYSICFLLLDLDHFKEINDTYGHLAGDQVLIYVAQQIKSLIRQSDPCFRYGGEEFLIVLPNLSLPEGLSRAEYIRQAIENKPFLYEGNFIHLSASLGLTVYPLHGENMDALLRGLDEALYRAKRSGRNRIEITGSDISTGS